MRDLSYSLTFRQVRGDWQLSDDGDSPLVSVSVRTSSLFSNKIEELQGRSDPACRRIPEFPLLLLFAIWAVLLEQDRPQGI